MRIAIPIIINVVNKLNNFSDQKHFSYTISDSLIVNKIPILLWITLVYIGAIVLQYISKPLFMPFFIVTIIIAIHILLYWFSDTLTKNKHTYYFIIQGLLIFIASFILPKGSIVLLVGLLPILIAQSITIFHQTFKVVFVFSLFYILYCIAIIINYDLSELPKFIPIFFFILIIVSFYSIIYNRQVNARIRMQYYLNQLEFAHKKVEELTLSNERQRMARDLHDTLAQGLAGLIMQLEAVESHLHKGNAVRSQEIILMSMEHARKTLRDSRVAIDNLRLKSLGEKDFREAVIDEINKFSEATSIPVEYDIQAIYKLNNLIREHSLYIISEGLTNIAKHSKATKAKITLNEGNKLLYIAMEDNGIGFSDKLIGKQPGKYGLLGLHERVRLIGGHINIQSNHDEGTNIYVKVPLNGKGYS